MKDSWAWALLYIPICAAAFGIGYGAYKTDRGSLKKRTEYLHCLEISTESEWQFERCLKLRKARELVE